MIMSNQRVFLWGGPGHGTFAEVPAAEARRGYLAWGATTYVKNHSLPSGELVFLSGDELAEIKRDSDAQGGDLRTQARWEAMVRLAHSITLAGARKCDGRSGVICSETRTNRSSVSAGLRSMKTERDSSVQRATGTQWARRVVRRFVGLIFVRRLRA